MDVANDVAYMDRATTPADMAPRQSQTDARNGFAGWFAQVLSASSISKTPDGEQSDEMPFPAHATLRTIDRAEAHSVRSTLSLSPVKPGMLRKAARQVIDANSEEIVKPPASTRWYDRAKLYIMDPDANPDKCRDDIWLLGVRHEGWRLEWRREATPHNSIRASTSVEILQATDAEFVQGSSNSPYSSPSKSNKGRLLSTIRRKQGSRRRTAAIGQTIKSKNSAHDNVSPLLNADRMGSTSDFTLIKSSCRPGSRNSSAGGTDTSSMSHHSSSVSASDDSSVSSAEGDRSRLSGRSARGEALPCLDVPPAAETVGWPPSFYWDFYSRIQLTYRSGFAPLHRSPESTMPKPSGTISSTFVGMMSGLGASIGRVGHQAILGGNYQRSYSSDSGWGCMLRTGQSLLANALLHVHLGRSWRRSMRDNSVSDTSGPRDIAYKRLMSLFLDDTDVQMHPFSVYQFAKEGERLGKPAGEWFGPSTAAGAIKALVAAYLPATLGVTVAYDTTIYQEEVFEAASNCLSPYTSWERPVLILVPSRLGIDRVNPVYYSAIKHYFTLRQCTGIAGGRPSSSYFFVGSQADSLFYLDPHHTAPAVTAAKASIEVRQQMNSTPISKTADEPDSHLSSFFADEYSMASFGSFHCKKVRKMSLSNLDPSMLLGLLCHNRADWDALCAELELIEKMSTGNMPIFNIEKMKPAWMRVPSRSLSFAATGVASPTAIPQQAAHSSIFIPSSHALQSGTSPSESIEYVDSDNWDIEDSDDDFAYSERRAAASEPSFERFSMDDTRNHSPQGTIVERPSHLDMVDDCQDVRVEEAVLLDDATANKEPIVVTADVMQ